MVPTISVIIPAYNEENYIRKTLHSIKNQSFQDFEVIVVTNGCTDATEEIVRKRVSDKLKHFSLPQPNVSRARNHGASKASGEILIFLDADTSLSDDSLHVIRQKFEAEHAVATTKVLPDLKSPKYTMAMQFKNIYNNSGLYKGCSGALICRREDFDKVNGYDPEIIVKEHRHLTKKLLKLGEYACLDTHVVTSMRRLQRWGLGKATFFWTVELLKDTFTDVKRSKYEKVR